MGLEVDHAFVQAPEHRPKPTISEAGGIPLVDLSASDLPALAAAVGAACRDWGFFQVVNHGVPRELTERLAGVERDFFALPKEEKRKVKRDEVNPLGYYDTEHTKNVRDWKEVFDFVVVEPSDDLPLDGDGSLVLKNKWPQHPPGFKEACKEYAKGVEELAFKLLELIAISLDLPTKRLHGFFADQTSFIRFNYYPPCPYPDLALGVGRHKDAGALTILYQDDVGGLDVKRKPDGEWARVKPIPNSFIINVGDIIQVWSNDRYESAEHRVSVNSERERFSIPYFFNPASNVMVKPLEELVDDERPARYEEYNWGNFFKTRKDSNFKKLEVENIQISHFKKA
ncbi:protein LATERAL BRANCHING OXIDOREDUCTASE 1-like [Typha latifolia]|uniref:protein LATERAL BRANCHING OXIDOREDUCTASE 1-like n=1 Tax=Typha latifolia TaxID=4733 RepID=UPI003C2C358C